MGVSITTKTLRIEINLTERESNYITRNLTLEGEPRKLAIERIIKEEIMLHKKRQVNRL